MGNTLFSFDYNQIIVGSFHYTENELSKYFKDIIKDNYDENRDIVEQLFVAIDSWREWHKNKVYSHWHVFTSEKGEDKEPDYEKTLVPLPIKGIFRSVNQPFFDSLQTAIELAAAKINLSETIDEFKQWHESQLIPPELKEPKYKYDTALIGKIYELSKDNVITCTDIEFMVCVGAANFSTITINKTAKMKWLIKTLSKEMGKNWYNETAKSVGYIDANGYNDCSRATISDTDNWAQRIKKLFPD